MDKLAVEKGTSFSLRKIPIKKNTEFFLEDEVDVDKVKILEFSNSIDKWEEELLLADDGFFSITGKQIQGKTKEFYNDLKEFSSRKIAELNLSDKTSLSIVSKVKHRKLETILQKMKFYENQQLKAWETNVYEEALSFAIKKAVSYKNNDEMIQLSLKNSFEILKVMAEKENWNKKTLLRKKEEFEEEFYLSLINSFLEEKDVRAEILFQKCKENIGESKRAILEDSLNLLKQNVIAFNFAKELFSYNLSKTDSEKEIKLIKNFEIEKLVRKFIKDFEVEKKKNEEKIDEEKNERNWQEIISKTKEDIEKSILYIDTALSKESQKSKKEYIEKIKKDGFIETDKEFFLNLLKEFIQKFDEFKKKNISDLRLKLSDEDFDFVSKLKQTTTDEYYLFLSDYNFITREFLNLKIDDKKEIYNLVKLYIACKNSFVSLNKKEPNIEDRNKFINAIFERLKGKD